MAPGWLLTRRIKRVVSAEEDACAMTEDQENRGKEIGITLLFLPGEEYWEILNIKPERQIGPQVLRVLNIRLNIFS